MQDWIWLTIGSIFLLLWLIFYLKGLSYGGMFGALEEKEYPLCQAYGLGYGILETIQYGYKSERDRKLRHSLEILYGNMYAEYYLRVVRAQQITLSFTVFVLSFVLYGLSQELGVLAIFWMFSALAFYYFGEEPKKKIDRRAQEILGDFSEVVSKLALLTNAGMILKEAWIEAAKGEGLIYKEMQASIIEMENGTSEADAIYNFGMRSANQEVKKFCSTLIQGMTKGNRDLGIALQNQSKEVWMLKKHMVRRLGEQAASKLLIPISIMFIGVLIMIIVPVFANLGG